MPVRRHDRVSKRTGKRKWVADIPDHVSPTGKRQRRPFETRKAAQAYHDRCVADALTGKRKQLTPTNTTFAEFIPTYLDYARLNKAEGTVEREIPLIRAHLLPYFGPTKLHAIDVAMIERYKLKRRNAGVAPRTINIEVTVLSVVFRTAMQHGMAFSNPVRDVQRLPVPKRPPRWLSKEEVSRLLAAAESSHLNVLVNLALYTGMRKAELFRMVWNDVDFDAGRVIVQPGKNYVFREIGMNDALRTALWPLWETSQTRDEYVLTWRGQPYVSNITKAWRALMESAEIENCTLHTLRHTFASHLATNGVPLAHIQKLMGHRDYKTTLVYAHLSSESVRDHVNRLDFS